MTYEDETQVSRESALRIMRAHGLDGEYDAARDYYIARVNGVEYLTEGGRDEPICELDHDEEA